MCCASSVTRAPEMYMRHTSDVRPGLVCDTYADAHGGPVRLHCGRPGYRLGRPPGHGLARAPAADPRQAASLGVLVLAALGCRARRARRVRPDLLAQHGHPRHVGRDLAGAVPADGPPATEHPRHLPARAGRVAARCASTAVTGDPGPHRSQRSSPCGSPSTPWGTTGTRPSPPPAPLENPHQRRARRRRCRSESRAPGHHRPGDAVAASTAYRARVPPRHRDRPALNVTDRSARNGRPQLGQAGSCWRVEERSSTSATTVT